MQNTTLKYVIQKFVCWILLLQMINISIDPPDIKLRKSSKKSIKKEVVVNDIESVFELISEYVFDTDVPEGEENEIEKNTSSILLYCYKPEPISLVDNTINLQHYPFYIEYSYPPHFDPSSPPPRVA